VVETLLVGVINNKVVSIRINKMSSRSELFLASLHLISCFRAKGNQHYRHMYDNVIESNLVFIKTIILPSISIDYRNI
jgi:hypothetical protein